MRPIFLGYSCNNACVFCAQGSLSGASRDPEDASVLADLEQALKDGAREVAFIGGEPTLRGALPGWIRHAKTLGATRILLQTNGRRLVYPEYVAGLRSAGLDACEVALQGSTAAMHDYHTGVPGSWLQTIGGLRQARRVGLEIAIGVVVTRSNFRHLSDLAVLAHGLGAKAIRLAPAQPFGRAFALQARVVPSPDLLEDFRLKALERARDLGLATFAQELAPDAARLYAGLGPVEPPPRAPAAAPAASPSRSKPGLRERRAARKRTGTELKAIFPALFEGERS